MKETLARTDFRLPGQKAVYHGKVRDVYTLENDLLVMIATDRISAFDVVLPAGIPYKGQVLNQIAAHYLDATRDVDDGQHVGQVSWWVRDDGYDLSDALVPPGPPHGSADLVRPGPERADP